MDELEVADIRSARDSPEYDTVAFRTFTSTVSSTVAGVIIGAVTATWQDVPAVERNVALPALKKTARMMGTYGAIYGAIGGTFGLVDAVSEKLRGKKDFFNGVFGGFAAGAIIGFRSGSVPMGLGAGAAMAAVSAFIDVGGQATRVPTGREYLPYPRETEKYEILGAVDKS
ncbi:unnamed protein product [Calypogeia fissa]